MTKRLKERDRFLLTCDFCNWQNFQQAIPGHFVNPPPKSCTLSASRIIFLRPCFPTASGLRGCLPSWLRCSSRRHSPGQTAATAWVVALPLCGSRWAGFQNRKGLTQITHMCGVLILYPIPPVSTTPEYLFWRLSQTVYDAFFWYVLFYLLNLFPICRRISPSKMQSSVFSTLVSALPGEGSASAPTAAASPWGCRSRRSTRASQALGRCGMAAPQRKRGHGAISEISMRL